MPTKTLLLRALGESLGGSVGVLDDPVITLYQGAVVLDSNDDTPSYSSGTPAEFAQVGARPTPNTLDATLVKTLAPGAYTVQVTPYAAGNSGTVLFELFEADAQRAATMAPVITYLAPDQSAIVGESAYFGVVVVGKPAATFQWRKGGVAIGGATSAVLQLNSVSAADVANYDVVVTSGAGTVTSPVRTLTLLPEFHSADSDHDRRISLLELTRVIQLFGYRSGATRTGEYHTQATGTEDGFALGPGAITSYHSADSNHDGQIDTFELLRVIQLYNFVSGSVRTGEYYPVPGTEDGFAPGIRPSRGG
ncbi:MAG: DVUA0089 family protein [Verrucomicrobia bacterium]|nr:DVUA0089 family protein [Verrucomicrobiota bacterium]